jgi:hypothetical protein
MQQFFSLLSWRLFTAQHVSGIFPPIIGSSMTAVTASGFIFVSWWQSCCVRGQAGWPDHEHSTAKLVIYLNCTMMHRLTNLKFYIKIFAHSVCKMWIIQESKKVALWNKRHFEEKNGECAACLKCLVLIFVEKIYKMQHLEGSSTPVLYIGCTVLNPYPANLENMVSS